MTKWILPISVLLLFFGACAKEEEPRYTAEELAQIPQPIRNGLPAPTGGFALAVGDEALSSADIIDPLLPNLTELARNTSYEKFTVQAARPVAIAIRDQVSDILLYQKAKKEAGDKIDDRLDDAVEKETRKFITRFGGDYAKAEAYLKDRYGMDWQQYKKQQRRMILSGSYIHGQLDDKTPVTYSDIKKYYDSVKDKLYSKPATITIRLIDIDISKVKPQDQMSAAESAEKTALEIMDKLNSGADFADLAKQYSNGYKKSAGGLWNPVNPDSLAEPYDVIKEEAERMIPSDITGPLKSGNHIFIIKLEDRQAASEIPMEDVQKEIEQQILQDRRIKNLDTVMAKVMADADIRGVDAFSKYCIDEIYRRANQQ